MTQVPENKYFLGLTGSIGMGKSTTAQMFRDLGVPVWDADAAVHALYDVGGEGVAAISKICPTAIIDGKVDRATLSAWVSSDPANLGLIEALIHPLVAQHRQNFIDETKAPILVFDIPLLFETGADAWLDGVVVVSTDPKTQRDRVMKRAGMTQEKFDLILSKQMPDPEKRAKADYVIASDSLEGAREAVRNVIEEIRKLTNA